MKTTDQVRPAPNPTGKGGFGDHPENRNPGGWKKEETVRYQVEQVAQMDDDALNAVIEDSKRPRLVRNFATAVKNSQWREIREIIEMIYGKPKESVDLTSKGKSINPYSELTVEELRKLASK
jgi:hypothetical protein